MMLSEKSERHAGSCDRTEPSATHRWVHHFLVWRDLYGGLFLSLLGVGVVAEGTRHPMGNLMRMGSGYFPVILGGVLSVVGVIMALGGVISGMKGLHSDPEPGEEFQLLDLRGGAAIIAGVVWFILVGAQFGLAPATFGLVFISASGDRSATLSGSLALAAAMTAIAAGLFWYALGVQFPLWGQ